MGRSIYLFDLYISPRFKYSQAYNDRHMEQKETDSEWLNYSQMILYDN